CQYPWQEYCRSVLVAVEFGLTASYGCVTTSTCLSCCSANSTATSTDRQYSCHGYWQPVDAMPVISCRGSVATLPSCCSSDCAISAVAFSIPDVAFVPRPGRNVVFFRSRYNAPASPPFS